MQTPDIDREFQVLGHPVRAHRGLSPEERESLLLQHLPQVSLIAGLIHERLPAGENVGLGEMFTAGVAGLISAIDRFDAHGIKLETYADYRIKGAILDHLRGLNPAGRESHERVSQLETGTPVEGLGDGGRDIPKSLWSHALQTFGSADSAAEWFLTECGALDNRVPIDVMGNKADKQEIDRILGCIDYGMVA